MIDYDDTKLDHSVPRFGSLANVKVTTIVLIGVWVLFLPVMLAAMVFMLAYCVSAPSFLAFLVASTVPMILLVLSAAILYRTTHKYLLRIS